MDQESGLQEDQRMQGFANLYKNNKKAESLQELAKICGFDPAEFEHQMFEYNENAKNKKDPQFHKNESYLEPLNNGPYYAINLNMTGNKYWPTPCMSLGGVVVDGLTGKVKTNNNSILNNVYACGRAAVGINSNYYVSGLSIADAIFSGRRAGRTMGNNNKLVNTIKSRL